MIYCISPECVNSCGRKLTPALRLAVCRTYGDDHQIPGASLCNEFGLPYSATLLDFQLNVEFFPLIVRQAEIPKLAAPARARMDQLDGLRALAILLTFISHFTYAHEGVMRLISSERPGSRLFFILSGFLITGLLLRYRQDVDLWGVVRRFHVRRLLRTLPLYYLVLGAAALLNMGHARDGFWWHAGFLSNFYLELYKPANSAVTHFWSLAVQEQFYLLWPFAVLFLPRRSLFLVMLACFAAGPLTRMACLSFGLGDASHLPFNCLDTLAGGAMLALAADRRLGNPKLRKQLVSWCVYLGVPAFALLALLNVYRPAHRIFETWSDTALALLFIALVDAAARTIRGPFGAVLNTKILQHIGRASYGIYVLHPFMPIVLFYVLKALKMNLPDGSFVWFATLAFMSIAAGTLSWRFVESPINRYKEYFPYSTERKHQRNKPAGVPTLHDLRHGQTAAGSLTAEQRIERAKKAEA